MIARYFTLTSMIAIVIPTGLLVVLGYFLLVKLLHLESRRAVARWGFAAHLLGFILINGMIFFYNFFVFPETVFFYFILIPWGIGLLIHAIFTLFIRETEVDFP